MNRRSYRMHDAGARDQTSCMASRPLQLVDKQKKKRTCLNELEAQFLPKSLALITLFEQLYFLPGYLRLAWPDLL